MRLLVLLLISCFPLVSFAQTTSVIEAPVGFLRNEPTVTAAIIYRIQENEKVQVLEKINSSWSKVAYIHHNKPTIGYLTNQTLGKATSVAKLSLIDTEPK